jgi:hypothetical protein
MAEPKVDEVVEHTNPRDEVADDVRSAIASLRGEAPEAPEPPPAEVAEPETAETVETVTEDRPRGPDGKFLPKAAAEVSKDAAPEKAAAPAPITPPSDNTKASAAQPSTAVGAPPVSWAADVKQAWPSLPPAVQQAVLKRETEVSNGFRQYSEQVRRYETAIAPVAEAAQRHGVPVETAIQRLMSAQEHLDRDPRAAIAWLAQSYNVDLSDLATNPPASQQPARSEQVVPPQVMNTISSLEQRLNGMLMDQNMSAVEQFAQANPHYGDVEDQLPGIMRELTASNPSLSGAPLLKAAYDRAIWLNPDVRAKLIAEQQAQTTQTKVAQVAAKASQAGRAAVSIKGSSAPAAAPRRPETNGNDVYADVKASIEQLRAQ